MNPLKLLVAAFLDVHVALGDTAVATARSDDEKVLLTVGVTSSVFDSAAR